MKLGRQVGIGVMKGVGALSIQKGTEETQRTNIRGLENVIISRLG